MEGQAAAVNTESREFERLESRLAEVRQHAGVIEVELDRVLHNVFGPQPPREIVTTMADPPGPVAVPREHQPATLGAVHDVVDETLRTLERMAEQAALLNRL